MFKQTAIAIQNKNNCLKLFVWCFIYALILIGIYGCDRQQKTVVVGGVLSTSDIVNQNKINGFTELLKAEIPNLNLVANETSNYQEAISNICQYKWDLSFAFSPIVASQAQKCGFTPLHSAFIYDYKKKNVNSYFVGFFSRKDSEINSLNDINGKSLALKQKHSASGYYVPLSMVYGKTLSKIGFLGTESEVARNVFIGNYDVGVAAMNYEAIMAFGKINNELKLIARSENIPGGALLVSNRLKEKIGDRLYERLLQALAKESIYERAPKLNTKDGDAYLYHPDYPPPNYQDFFEFTIEKIDRIGDCYLETPAKVFDCRNKSKHNY